MSIANQVGHWRLSLFDAFEFRRFTHADGNQFGLSERLNKAPDLAVSADF